jgi:hypothetical protein
VRSGPTWRPPKIEPEGLLRPYLQRRPSLSTWRFESALVVPGVVRIVGSVAEAALATAQAGISSDRYSGLAFSTEGSGSWSRASRARSTDGRGASSAGPSLGRPLRAFTNGAERKVRMRPSMARMRAFRSQNRDQEERGFGIRSRGPEATLLLRLHSQSTKPFDGV